MVLTSHNKILGWVHSVKFNDNNVLSGRSQLSNIPYPIIIATPSITQCWKNWNIADTGMMFAVIVSSVFIAYPLTYRAAHSIIQRKVLFYRMIGLSVGYGLIFGLRNSSYRLQGLVPNGLHNEEGPRQVKYDYTSEFLDKSFLGYFIESPKQDTSNKN